MAYEVTNNIKPKVKKPIGITYPMVSTGGVLFNQSYTSLEQAKTNLINLLLTRKGERIMLPTFGTGLMSFLFESDLSTVANNIRDEIIRSVDVWLPYLSIQRLEVLLPANTAPNQNELKIELEVSLNGRIETVPISFLLTPNELTLL